VQEFADEIGAGLSDHPAIIGAARAILARRSRFYEVASVFVRCDQERYLWHVDSPATTKTPTIKARTLNPELTDVAGSWLHAPPRNVYNYCRHNRQKNSLQNKQGYRDGTGRGFPKAIISCRHKQQQ